METELHLGARRQLCNVFCTETPKCTQNRRKCPGCDKCIPICYFCDGEDDCGDGSDETSEFCGE